jgi:hypothetical protein
MIEDKDIRAKTSPAYLLIIRQGIQSLLNIDDLYNEQKSLTWDTKALMSPR